jgi:hypothetical protein
MGGNRVEGGVLLAESKGIALPSRDILFLFDGVVMKPSEESIVATELYRVTDRSAIYSIMNLDQLAQVVNGHAAIAHLVLDFHGSPGSITVGGEPRPLDEHSFVEAFKPKAGVLPPRINEISFFGCEIGQKPRRVAAFGKLFDAKQMSAYTWPIRTESRIMRFPKGNDAATVQATIKPYEAFIIPRADPAAIANECRTRDITKMFVVVYGSQDGTRATFPLPFGADRTYKPLKDAEPKRITFKAATAMEHEINSPAPPFQLVVIQ